MATAVVPTRRTRREDANLTDAIDKVFNRVGPLIKLVQTFSEQSRQTREGEERFKSKLARFAAIIVGLVVGSSAFPTYEGKMDDSTFGFLLGLVVGYILPSVGDANYPPKSQ